MKLRSDRARSAVLIPVPEAEDAVGRWRRLYDPMAPAGVPAHITLIVPWLAPEAITDAELGRLEAVVAKVLPFEYVLRHIGWFARRVLWLGPDPVQPFVDLTRALADEFETPPWAGEFDRVVPHLTVAHDGEGANLATVVAALGNDLPITCHARQATVMVGDGVRWWELSSSRWPRTEP